MPKRHWTYVDDPLALGERLKEARERSADDVARARALAGLAQLAAREGNLDDAVEPLEEAYRLLGDRSLDYPAIPETLGTAYAMRGEFESALAVFDDALAHAREREDEH